MIFAYLGFVGAAIGLAAFVFARWDLIDARAERRRAAIELKYAGRHLARAQEYVELLRSEKSSLCADTEARERVNKWFTPRKDQKP